MVTKDMERKALEKIRKIVKELGDDSYVAMAFEGVFEVAEENIQNDFGCSLLQRAQSAEKSLHEAIEKLRAAKIAEDMLKTENLGLRERVLGQESLKTAIEVLEESLMDVYRKIDTSEREIIKNAENPASMEFRTAVKVNREMEERKTRYEALLEKLNEEVTK